MFRIIWIGHRGSDAEILASVAPVRAIICCDWDADLCELSKHIPVSSIERDTLNRLVWSSASLASMSREALRETLEKLPRDEPIVVVPYRSTHWIESVVSIFPHVRLAAARAQIVERLDDKIIQRKLFTKLALPTPRWQVVNSHQLTEFGVWRNIGFPAVAQLPRGSLGIGTFLIESRDDRPKLNVERSQKLLVSEYVRGPVINCTAVVGRADVHLARPSIQLVGLPILTGTEDPFRYCGNDFGAASYLPRDAIDLLFSCIRVLGGELRRLGYLGIFGTDWIFSEGRWFILELNPRFQGSTLCLTSLELEAGRVPLVVEHLRAFVEDSTIVEAGRRSPSPATLTGSQVVLYQRQNNWVNVEKLSVSDRLEFGHPHRAKWKVIGRPVVGTKALPHAILERIFLSRSILNASYGKLISDVEGHISMFYAETAVIDFCRQC